MTRSSSRVFAALASAAVTGALLSGCVPEAPTGEPLPDIAGVTIEEVLGLEVDADGRMFLADARDRADELAAWGDELDRRTADELALATAEWLAGITSVDDGEGAQGASDAPAIQGALATVEPAAVAALPAVPVVAPSFAGGPGIDVPIVTTEFRVSTDEAGGHPVTTTTESTTRLEQQVQTTEHSVTAVAGDPANPVASEHDEVRTETVNCPPEGQPHGEWSVESTQTVTGANGESVVITSAIGGEWKRNKHGTLDLRNVRFSVEATATVPGADPVATPPIEVSIDIYAWETTTDITSAVGRVEATQAPDATKADEARALAVLMLSIHQGVPKSTAYQADAMRDYRGICVRLVTDTHGRTKLGDGERTAFDAWVIDPKTGAELGDARIEATSFDGVVAPPESTGRGTFDFTAEGDPIYRVSLSTHTKRGGHALQIHYGAHGWRFSGIVDSYTIPSHLGPIPARTTWSGEVCGDVWSMWHLTAVVEGEGASHPVSLPMRPAEVEDAPPGTRAILLYQEVPEPAEGELPFKLWIDEFNPERVPNHSRIEIVPEPLDTCIEG